MRIAITLEHKFCRTPDGAVWSRSQFPYAFWRKHLDVFDEVRIVARVQEVEKAEGQWLRASGEGVAFSPVPYYVGPVAFARNYAAIRRAVRAGITDDSAALLRVSSPIGTLAHSILRHRRQPFGVCVVSDPKTAFAPGVIDHPLRAFFRWKLTRDLRRQCATAASASYITSSYLQGVYPPSDEAFVASVSDAELPEDAFADGPKLSCGAGRKRLITVVSLAQRYKGVDVLLDALHRCVRSGMDLELAIAGDGVYRSELEDQARRLGLLGDRVRFLGLLPGAEAVRAELSRSDLFVLPSRTEAQGRALLEAMAQGLPCVASDTGGITELMIPGDMAPPGDVDQLAGLIGDMVANAGRMARSATLGMRTARRFHADHLRAARNRFLRELFAQTRDWQPSRGNAGLNRSAPA